MMTISETYDWKITLKKFILYFFIVLAVAYVVLMALPEATWIAISLSVIIALMNFIKNSGIFTPGELPPVGKKVKRKK